MRRHKNRVPRKKYAFDPPAGQQISTTARAAPNQIISQGVSGNIIIMHVLSQPHLSSTQEDSSRTGRHPANRLRRRRKNSARRCASATSSPNTIAVKTAAAAAAVLLLCQQQGRVQALVPSHGGVFWSIFGGASRGGASPTASSSSRGGGMEMRSTLTPPPQQTETIEGGTQTVREMSAQMSQVRATTEGGRNGAPIC